MMTPVKVIRVESASFPIGSASLGFDLCADIKAPKTIEPGENIIIPTGIAIDVPDGFCALICANNTLAQLNSLMIANTPSIARSRIPIEVNLANVGKTSFTIDPGKRIAVLLILPVAEINLVPVLNWETNDARNDLTPCPSK